VRAINAAEVSSGWAYSQEKTLTGKIGLPSAPVSLTTTSLLHGVQLNWAFPEEVAIRKKPSCSTAQIQPATARWRFLT
jgi:predicted phage tail protein